MLRLNAQDSDLQHKERAYKVRLDVMGYIPLFMDTSRYRQMPQICDFIRLFCISLSFSGRLPKMRQQLGGEEENVVLSHVKAFSAYANFGVIACALKCSQTAGCALSDPDTKNRTHT